MIKKVLVQKVEPGGLRVRNKMDLVALFCQRFAELGGYYTATTKGGVAHYTNLDLIHGVVELWNY